MGKKITENKTLMKKIFLLAFALPVAAVILSCSDTQKTSGAGNELLLEPSVEAFTRAIGDDFFTDGGQIDVTLTTLHEPAQAVYSYIYGVDRIFHGNPPFRFSLDDDYITSLKAEWPSEAVRGQGIKTDQRLLADYKQADWMSFTAGAEIIEYGIMPTDAPVPLTFTRENSMLEFELVGQNTEVLNIQSLIFELQIKGVPTACWAYCGNPNGHAELILEAGTVISSADEYLIGRVSVSDDSQYTIIFPETNVTLEAGKRYLVTLTPQGYNMNTYVFIAGFSDGENGIGIPFQQPTPDVNGTFRIDNFTQLSTMAYLIRHYNDPAGFDWRTRTYIIGDTFSLTAEQAAAYIPIPRSLFKGRIERGGVSISSITYGDNNENTLNLFDENN